jgi:hypothetical protein
LRLQNIRADGAELWAPQIPADFSGVFTTSEKGVFGAKRSLTPHRGAHRNRAFRRDLDGFGPHAPGIGFAWAGSRELPLKGTSRAALFDIVISEKGNAGGGALRVRLDLAKRR